MRKIKSYNDFCNEEINLKKALVGGAMIAGLATTPSCNKVTSAEYNDTEQIGSTKFKEYDISTIGMDRDLYITIGEDSIITTKFTHHHGKSSTTYVTVTVDEGINEIYYDNGWSYTYSSSKPIDDDRINLNDLEVVENNQQYKILKVTGWFNTIDYIMVNKGYSNVQNQFDIDGKKYTYLKYDPGFLSSHIYFVTPVK